MPEATAETAERKIAREIADQLGEEWCSVAGHMVAGNDAWLKGPDGARFHVRSPGSRRADVGKVVIQVAMPPDLVKHVPYGREDDARLSITVTMRKGAARIAADITGKLLDTARSVVAAARVERSADLAAGVAQTELVGEIVEALGGAYRKLDVVPGYQTEISVGSVLTDDRIYGSMTVTVAGSEVGVKLHVQKVHAVAFARALATVLSEVGKGEA